VKGFQPLELCNPTMDLTRFSLMMVRRDGLKCYCYQRCCTRYLYSWSKY